MWSHSSPMCFKKCGNEKNYTNPSKIGWLMKLRREIRVCTGIMQSIIKRGEEEKSNAEKMSVIFFLAFFLSISPFLTFQPGLVAQKKGEEKRDSSLRASSFPLSFFFGTQSHGNPDLDQPDKQKNQLQEKFALLARLPSRSRYSSKYLSHLFLRSSIPNRVCWLTWFVLSLTLPVGRKKRTRLIRVFFPSNQQPQTNHRVQILKKWKMCSQKRLFIEQTTQLQIVFTKRGHLLHIFDNTCTSHYSRMKKLENHFTIGFHLLVHCFNTYFS